MTVIGESAFEGCTGLTAITIPEGVTTIEDWAFQGCIGLTAITFPESVTTIGEGAFYDCAGLTNVKIGNGVTAIGNRAFEWCEKLKTVTMHGSAPTLGEDVFENCAEGLTFHVPWNAAGYDAAPWNGYEVLYDVLAAPEIRSVSNTANGVQITWDAVPGAVQYRVFYETDNGGWSKIADTADTSYTWENAQDGTTYTFTVRCLSADGESYTSDYAIGKTITYKEEPGSGTASDQPSGKDPADQNAGSENPDNGNQSEAVAGSGSPETGDSMSLLLWTALLLIGACAGSLTLVLRRWIQS